jgi:Domain of unknown function (DUF4062)
MASTGRPIVFVSSTVFDFRDLRSALKYWLEELGYDPRLSEFNDFPKPLDDNSYDACLKTIEDADYFVLLIGSRVGGWYNESEKLSITRAEYRHAYESFMRTGRPRIVSFVRGDVWNVKDDRADLAKLLEKDAGLQKEVSAENAAKITHAPTRFVNDATAIFSFIDEIKRKDEMVAATAKGQGFPPGNWVHSFNTFADIIDVLRVQARAGSVRRAAIVANLREETTANADDLLMEHRMMLTAYIRALVKRYIAMVPPSEDQVKLAFLQKAKLTLSAQESKELAFFTIVTGSTGRNMRTAAIEQAIASGEFLRWESAVHAYVPTLAQHALLRLRGEIEFLRRNESFYTTDQFRSWVGPVHAGEPTTVSLFDFVPIVSVHNRHQNIAQLIAALHDYFESGNDDALANVRLWGRSNISTEREPLQGEVASSVRVAMWLADRAAEIKQQMQPAVPATSSAGAASGTMNLHEVT